MRALRNKVLLWLGFTLINKRNPHKVVTVSLKHGKQVKSNSNRITNYKMDDIGWKILW